jgi:F-type H+-transporting ATPase subunit b
VQRAVVTVNGLDVEVALSGAPLPATEEGEEEAEEVAENDKNPIAPEPKEIIWGFGSFVVFALLMRFWLYPRLRKGMDARYSLIRGGHEEAEYVKDSARAELTDYETQLAAIKADAQARIEAQRRILEQERAERLAEVNARIGEKRAAAATEVERAREAAGADVENAVKTVAARAAELVLGRAPDQATVDAAVADVMSAAVSR